MRLHFNDTIAQALSHADEDHARRQIVAGLIQVISEAPSSDLGSLKLCNFFQVLSVAVRSLDAEQLANVGVVEFDISKSNGGSVNKEDCDISHGEKSVEGGAAMVKPSALDQPGGSESFMRQLRGEES